MAINYNTDIVAALFATDVESAAAYQAPGTYGLPAHYGKYRLDSTSSINAAGTGYSVSDILTLSGGTSSTAASIQVTSVDSGAVTRFEIVDPGVYTALPSNPISVTGGGSSFKLTGVWKGAADQRILTFIELMRSYIAEMTTEHEQKLVMTVIRRMVAEMRFGTTYAASTQATNAQKAALKYIAGNPAKLNGVL